MRRGTTPTLQLHVEGETFSGADLIYVVLRQGPCEIVKVPGVTVEDTDSTLSVSYTQAETLALHAGKEAQIQIRYKESGVVKSSEIKDVMVDETLWEAIL